MNRRKFISAATGALGALGLSGKGSAGQSTAAVDDTSAAGRGGSAPNVLILMTDQHRRGCMGAAGDSVAITPHLDKLASESVRFTDAYCTNPVCAPSRASILTGLYSHHLGSRGNETAYSPRHKTIADDFARAGYMTALIGKMHMVDAQTHGFNYKLEFNDWWQYLGPKTKMYSDELGRPNSGAGLPQVPYLWAEEGDPWKGDRTPDGRLGSVAVGRPSLMQEQDHFENFVARESVRFLEKYAGENQPFLLVSSLLKPHDPFMPATRFARMFEADKMTLPKTWGKADLQHLPRAVVEAIETCHWTPELLHASAARQRMAYYYANLAQSDDCVGQILAALSRLGLDRNTIVVYTSDHGEMLGDLGLWNKFQFYEGSCGIPLTVRVPGRAPAVCSQPVSLISLKATLGEMCQTPISTPNDGKSFAYLVRNPASTASYGPVFAEYDLGSETAKYMVRDGDYKYTFWVHDLAELYNLRDDPEEMRNLAQRAEYRETVERLKNELFAWHRPPELDRA